MYCNRRDSFQIILKRFDVVVTAYYEVYAQSKHKNVFLLWFAYHHTKVEQTERMNNEKEELSKNIKDIACEDDKREATLTEQTGIMSMYIYYTKGVKRMGKQSTGNGIYLENMILMRSYLSCIFWPLLVMRE